MSSRITDITVRTPFAPSRTCAPKPTQEEGQGWLSICPFLSFGNEFSSGHHRCWRKINDHSGRRCSFMARKDLCGLTIVFNDNWLFVCSCIIPGCYNRSIIKVQQYKHLFPDPQFYRCPLGMVLTVTFQPFQVMDWSTGGSVDLGYSSTPASLTMITGNLYLSCSIAFGTLIGLAIYLADIGRFPHIYHTYTAGGLCRYQYIWHLFFVNWSRYIFVMDLLFFGHFCRWTFKEPFKVFLLRYVSGFYL